MDDGMNAVCGFVIFVTTWLTAICDDYWHFWWRVQALSSTWRRRMWVSIYRRRILIRAKLSRQARNDDVVCGRRWWRVAWSCRKLFAAMTTTRWKAWKDFLGHQRGSEEGLAMADGGASCYSRRSCCSVTRVVAHVCVTTQEYLNRKKETRRRHDITAVTVTRSCGVPLQRHVSKGYCSWCFR